MFRTQFDSANTSTSGRMDGSAHVRDQFSIFISLMSAPAPSLFSPAALEMAARLGLKMGRANLDVFAETLLGLAQSDRNVLAITSDSRGSGKLGPFGAALPDQLVEVGIAEQNLVGIAAGLASAGKTVYAVSPACFLTARSLEQIKNDVAYSDNPVKVIGISAGVSYGALGSTHHSLHDLAALRAINNLEVIVPADNFETRQAISAVAVRKRPVYVRFGKAPMYDLPRVESSFEIGKAVTLRDGRDVAFMATGETVVHALLAAAKLESDSLSCRVLSLHTIKPLDIEAVLRAGRECRALVTVEEHMVNGGLGEACAAVLLEAGVALPFKRVAIPDEYTVTGSQADIFRHYGISMEGLAQTARRVLRGFHDSHLQS
jgi:transketolase